MCTQLFWYYLSNEAGHLVAVKLIGVITINVNHSHVESFSLSLLEMQLLSKRWCKKKFKVQPYQNFKPPKGTGVR